MAGIEGFEVEESNVLTALYTMNPMPVDSNELRKSTRLGKGEDVLGVDFTRRRNTHYLFDLRQPNHPLAFHGFEFLARLLKSWQRGYLSENNEKQN